MKTFRYFLLRAAAGLLLLVTTYVVQAIFVGNGSIGPSAQAASTECKSFSGSELKACEEGVKEQQSGTTHAKACKKFKLKENAACQTGFDESAKGRLVTPPHAPNNDCNGGGVKVSPALGVSGNCVGGNGTNPIFALMSVVIKWLSAIFGLVLVLVLVIAGIQYITSAGSPDGAKDAKNRIKAAVTGLVLFVLMFGILQIILPPEAKVFR